LAFLENKAFAALTSGPGNLISLFSAGFFSKYALKFPIEEVPGLVAGAREWRRDANHQLFTHTLYNS
jgi:hypothetical protein